MAKIASVLILIVLTGNGEILLGNTPCPSLCVCNGDTATCDGHGSHQRYIPPLPENTTSLIFRHYSLGYMRADVFKNISSLHLTKLDLTNNRIVNID